MPPVFYFYSLYTIRWRREVIKIQYNPNSYQSLQKASHVCSWIHVCFHLFRFCFSSVPRSSAEAIKICWYTVSSSFSVHIFAHPYIHISHSPIHKTKRDDISPPYFLFILLPMLQSRTTSFPQCFHKVQQDSSFLFTDFKNSN